MADIAKVKRNVSKMVSMNAPEKDIDSYISSEGVTIDDIRNYKEQPAQPQALGFGQSIVQQGKNALTDIKDIAQMPYTIPKQMGQALAETPGFIKEQYKQGGLGGVVRGVGQGVAEGLGNTASVIAQPFLHPVQSASEHPIQTALAFSPLATAKTLSVASNIPKSMGSAVKNLVRPKSPVNNLWEAIGGQKTNTKLYGAVQEAYPVLKEEISKIGQVPKTNSELLSVIRNKQDALMAEKADILGQYTERTISGDSIY